jgi:hypothetical protein
MKILFRHKLEFGIQENVTMLEIHEDIDCFFLFLYDSDAVCVGDYWGSDLEDVMAQAEFMFSVKKEMWHIVE